MPEKSLSVECYLVGGAVRDKLLGLEPCERDWLVVGSTPEKMKAAGYKEVGRDFPVYLHPQTHEEYALARTERKTGPGYGGFDVHASPSVTLEQDLKRRDLTINAMAKSKDGLLADPFGGKADLERRFLRHVSPAFAEDPLRVLRVARFKAQLCEFDFEIAEQTLALMRQITQSGELDALKPDRIWKETEKALATKRPAIYFESLRACGALKIIYPEIDALFGVPQRADYHPEIDSGIHTMMVVDRSAELSDDLAVRFAAATHDLGKALTPVSLWPRHVGHEKKGLKPLEQLCQRLPVPKKMRRTAELCCEHHLLMHKLGELRPETILKLIERLDGFRHPEHIEQYATLCQADSQGRKGQKDKPYSQASQLRQIFKSIKNISARDVDKDLTGPELGKAIREKRVSKIRELIIRK